MAVRVKLNIGVKNKAVSTTGLVNTGYEASECDIMIPSKLAEKLNLWPHLPDDTKIKDYEVASGEVVGFYRLPILCEVSVITEDKTSKSVPTNIVISETQKEVIMSDKLIDKLNIEIVKPGKGIWRFSGENKLRKSELPKYW